MVFAYELWTQSTGGDAALDQLFATYGLVPATVVSSVKAGGIGALLGDGAVPVLTSMFLHGGWIHLIGNMLYLWIFGNNIEDRFGRIGFLLFYLFGGAMAAVTQVWIDPTSTVPIIGASGRDRGGPRRVPRPVPAGPGPVARLPRLLLPAAPGAGADRARDVVRPPAGRRARVARRPGARTAASPSSRTSAGSSPAPAIAAIVRAIGVGRLDAPTRAARRVPRGIIPAMASEEPRARNGLVEMVVESVRVHMLSSRHVVILKETDHDRYLPIWIGPWEASAIAMKLQGLTADRPLTHDLFASALESLGVRVDRVVISTLAEETYHARLHLERDGDDVRDRLAAVRRAGPRRPDRRPDLRQRGGARAGGARRPTPRDEEGEGERRGDAARVDRRADRRPAARHLPRLRELARRRPRDRRGPDAARSHRLSRSRALASRDGRRRDGRGQPRIGSPRRSARPRFDHIRRRRSQKSRTARNTTRRLRARSREPAVRG